MAIFEAIVVRNDRSTVLSASGSRSSTVLDHIQSDDCLPCLLPKILLPVLNHRLLLTQYLFASHFN